MGSFYMEATQINYRRDETFKTVDQKLQELSETSAIDTDIAPVFKSTNTYAPGDLVYYRNKLYRFNVEHTGAWAAGDVTATDVTTEVSSLRSGLTNVNVALDVPDGSGKNLIPLSLSNMKSANTTGTWADNVYSISDITITVNSDASGNVTDLSVNGTASARVDFVIATKEQYPVPLKGGSYIISGSTGGSTNTYAIWVQNHGSVASEMSTDGEGTFTFTAGASSKVNLAIFSGVQLSNKAFYPMLRYASITDPTYAPYIPSVESRLEAVESKLIFTSATTGTMKAKLSSIQPYFNALSDEQRRHAYLVHDNNVLFIENTYGARFGSAVRYAASNSKIIFYIVQLNASDSSYVVPSIDTSGFTLEDRSSEENANAVSLYIN